MSRGLWLTRILDFISPRHCVVCSRRLAAAEGSVCSVCMLHMPRTTYQFTPTDNPMAQLFWHLVPVERAAALVFYEPHSEMARIVYALKYGDRPDIGEDMGRLMAEEMQLARYLEGIDLLLPVPLSPRRKRQRGYNQCELLARGISSKTSLPIASKAIGRRHFLKSQTRLSRQERQANVSNMFVLRDAAQLRGKHVLLVDDVCTTGATLTACAEVLRSVEGIRISVLTFGFTKR
ncbi:MAG: ComF family protein [Prevotella sp.]|nr:ComF family protein [Prevotella sp.]